MFGTVVGGSLVFLATLLVWHGFRRYYGKKTGLSAMPGPKGTSWLGGNLGELLSPGAWEYHSHLAKKYGSIFKVKAFCGDNMLYVYDPKALHHIFVKSTGLPHQDQNIFEESDDFITSNSLAFGKGLLGTLGERHRKQRKLLNPVFSIAHMRSMIPIFYEVAYKTRDALMRQVADGQKEIDMLSWTTRTALELIAQSGLGLSLDSLTEDNAEHPYATSVKNYAALINSFTFSRLLLRPAAKVGSAGFRRWLLNVVPWKKLHTIRDMVDVMHDTSVQIFQSKKRALEAGDDVLTEETGRDIISILLRANTLATEDDRLPDEEVLAQISTIMFAAMDTTSNALARVLHLISQHPEVQSRLRQEIRHARKENGDLQYDDLVSLPYLDAVCRETLRLYPPLPLVLRQCRTDAVLPFSKPVVSVDGEQMNEALVPRNTLVLVPLMACNRNPDIWGPDSDEWKPERWLSPLPDSVANAHVPGIYSHLMTFIGGGRACIGFKFSQLEMKVVLCLLLESFQFSLTDKRVIWKMNGILQPTIEGEARLQLPLNVAIAPA